MNFDSHVPTDVEGIVLAPPTVWQRAALARSLKVCRHGVAVVTARADTTEGGRHE